MIKQNIISQIGLKLGQMGIPYQIGNGADITIFTEFLDAGWSTGSRKITYEASVFADESSNTVFMWEMTRETGHGLSFGGESGTSFQSGKTLFRKVKSIQYGPEGKAYEYTLDLGAIPKSVRETAKQFGWKFKTVINKGKATYPAGYMPPLFAAPGSGYGGNPQQPCEQVPHAAQAGGGFCTECGAQLIEGARFCDKCGKPVAAVSGVSFAAASSMQAEPIYRQQAYSQYGAPNAPFSAEAKRKSGGRGGTFGLIGFILLGVLLVAALAAGKATPAGWGISAAIFLLAFFIQRRISKKGCLSNLILWLVTGFILLILLTIVTTEDISFTTARLKNAHMTTAMDSGGKPVDSVDSYPASAPQLVAVAELHNAPVSTKVKFIWKYVTGNMIINEFVMDSGNNDANVYVFSTLTNDRPWPEGKYRVEMYVEDRKTPDAAIEFEVTADADGLYAGGASSPTLPANGSTAAFRVDFLSYAVYPSFTYKSDSGNDMYLGVGGDIEFTLNANTAAFSDPTDKVEKITAKFSLLKTPSFGAVKLYRFRPDLAVAPSTPSEMKAYGLPMTFDIAVVNDVSESEKPENYLICYDNSINCGQIRIYYCIENLMPIELSSGGWKDAIPAAVSKGMDSDSLRSNVGIELLIKMKSGERHRIYFEREMMQGDFFSKTRLNNIVEDYQGKETPILSEKLQ